MISEEIIVDVEVQQRLCECFVEESGKKLVSNLGCEFTAEFICIQNTEDRESGLWRREREREKRGRIMRDREGVG